jgi:hypothetical protein
MEDRSTLLKIYNDRTTILNKATWSLKELLDYLDNRALHLSRHLLSAMANSSTVSGLIRGELLIEGILQFLKGKRDYFSESSLLNSMFQKEDFWTFQEFRETFSRNFESLYEMNEICRILQLVKRFGLDSQDLVTFEYFSKLVLTSQLKTFDLVRKCKTLSQVIKKSFIKIAFISILKSENFKKIRKFPDFQEFPRKPLKVERKPLEIISNTAVSVTRTVNKDSGNSKTLRSKLFIQACKNFCLTFEKKLKFETFVIVKNPYKSRDPFIHRAIFKVYLMIRNKACEILSKALMKWNNLPDVFIDCVKDLTGTTGFTRENTVGYSKQYSFLTLTHEYIEKNSKVSALLLQKSLIIALNRVKTFYISKFFPNLKKPLKKMTENLKKFQFFSLRKAFSQFFTFSTISKYLEELSKKQVHQAKRQKYSLPSKARKIAARSLCKMIKTLHMQRFFTRFRTNTRFPSRKIGRSLNRTVEISLPKKPEGLSRSFVESSRDLSPRFYERCKNMKQSAQKVRVMNGIHQIIVIFRKIQQKKIEKPLQRGFFLWKTLKNGKSFLINLKKVPKSHHSSQFSFRDKV